MASFAGFSLPAHLCGTRRCGFHKDWCWSSAMILHQQGFANQLGVWNWGPATKRLGFELPGLEFVYQLDPWQKLMLLLRFSGRHRSACRPGPPFCFNSRTLTKPLRKPDAALMKSFKRCETVCSYRYVKKFTSLHTCVYIYMYLHTYICITETLVESLSAAHPRSDKSFIKSTFAPQQSWGPGQNPQP